MAFRVEGLGFRVSGLWFRVEVFGVRAIKAEKAGSMILKPVATIPCTPRPQPYIKMYMS